MKAFTTNDSLYIIFRVHDIFDEDIAFRLYVDPVQLEGQGKLCFHWDGWHQKYKVTPVN
jgi:hypothetical protein